MQSFDSDITIINTGFSAVVPFTILCINCIIKYINYTQEVIEIMASNVYVKNPNGTTYVYENISYWDKDEKRTKHRRKCIGKVDPVTKQIIQTGKKTDIKPDGALQKNEHCRVLTIGPALLLDKAAAQTKLDRVLRLIFPEDHEQILMCAYYLASEGKALCHAEQWSSRNRQPYGEKLPDQRISELLGWITPSKQQDFFSMWADINHDSGYFALDITSVSSYSEMIDFVRRGYNRDGDDLAQINLLMITSENTHLPIYYRILSGSIKDVSTLKESVGNLKLLNTKAVRLIMDKGFYSEQNVDALYEGRYKFSIGVPFTTSMAGNTVKENRNGMDSHHNLICVDGDDVYAITRLIKWKGHRCYQHIYFDSLKAELENRKFTHRLKECYDALCSGSEKAKDVPFINKYFMVTTYPKRQRKIEYNEDAIREHKENNIGWFVLISNDIRDAAEALLAYRRKDAVEKNFDDLKNDLDMKRLRIHTNAAMEGRIFIQFISLILTTYLKEIMEKNSWTRNHNLQKIFSEMKSLKQVEVEGKRKKLVTTPTAFQQKIMELYQVTP